MSICVSKRIQLEYETVLKNIGEDRFLKHIFNNGISARKHYDYPEITMLEQSDAFFSLFRTTGNINYFTIGKILRKAAHMLYRDGKGKCKEYPVNKKFLDLVK